MMDQALDEGLAPPDKLGRVKRIDDSQARYIEIAKASFPKGLSLQGLRIAIDCANGAGYKVAPTTLYELGAEVFAVGVEPNGLNINKNCGSTHPQTLAETVRLHQAHIGIALDGDADRVIICDENGQIIDGDQIMTMVALGLGQARPAGRGRRGRHGHVQPRDGASTECRRPDAGADQGRRPLCHGADARGGLQHRRRTVRPHHPARPRHHRRRPDVGAAGPGRAGRERPRHERSGPTVRTGAATARECALHVRQAAAGRGGQGRHRRGGGAPGRGRTPSGPAFRNRETDPGDGRGR